MIKLLYFTSQCTHCNIRVVCFVSNGSEQTGQYYLCQGFHVAMLTLSIQGLQIIHIKVWLSPVIQLETFSYRGGLFV